jgi:hypothetical protein
MIKRTGSARLGNGSNKSLASEGHGYLNNGFCRTAVGLSLLLLVPLYRQTHLGAFVAEAVLEVTVVNAVTWSLYSLHSSQVGRHRRLL